MDSLKAVLILSLFVSAVSPVTNVFAESHADMSDKPKLENLMRAALESAEGMEVIVSRVTIPPNTSLAKHWHPGDEFAYILEGSVTLWQKDKDDIVGVAGDVMKVPLKQVHTAMTGEVGAVILVFRVHQKGEPERFAVED